MTHIFRSPLTIVLKSWSTSVIVQGIVLIDSQVDVTTSCTIRLNDEVYCIRDGGEWSNCPNGAGVNDLIIAIEKAYYRS